MKTSFLVDQLEQLNTTQPAAGVSLLSIFEHGDQFKQNLV
jgi:hypothetical protein